MGDEWEMNLTKKNIEEFEKAFNEYFKCTCGYHTNLYCHKCGKFDDIYEIVEGAFEKFFDLLKGIAE